MRIWTGTLNHHYKGITKRVQNVALLPEELVMGGAGVHETVGDDGGGVTDGHPHRVLGLLQDQRVRVVVADEELEVEIDGLLSVEDADQLVYLGLEGGVHLGRLDLGWLLRGLVSVHGLGGLS